MAWLNYHHLLYFWTTACEGTMSGAARKLRVTQPTVSGQIRELEERLGGALFERRGNALELTALGQQVFGYADEIFTLGEELMASIDGQTGRKVRRFAVGVVDPLPKLVVMQLLRPVLALPEPVQLAVRQGNLDTLLGELSTHALDMVLSDAPISPHLHVRAYNHVLGASPIGVFAIEPLAKRLRDGFPASLHDAPLIVPTTPGMLRRSLDYWLEQQRLAPRLVAEVEDSALLKAFARAGDGAVISPLVIEPQLRELYGLHRVGVCDGLDEHYYAISVERRIQHPAVAAVVAAAEGIMGG
jgi:LysR family transcriptional regulator, transcriptional activator of nhaA